MRFFEPPPPVEPPAFEQPERRPWWGPPENELGAPVPLRLILARTERLVVAVLDAVAYTTGVDLRLAIKARIDPDARPGPQDRFHDPLGRMRSLWPDGGEPSDEVLRFGVQFSDGRKATTLGRSFLGTPEEPHDPVLAPGGGSGSDHEWETSFWLWPLPPPGTLAFVVEWPAEGIAETRSEVEADGLLEAARRSEVLWPGGGGRGGPGSWTGYGRT